MMGTLRKAVGPLLVLCILLAALWLLHNELQAYRLGLSRTV